MGSITIEEKKQTGSHYTPEVLANFVAKALSIVSKKKSPKILDPACGDGELLFSIKQYYPSAQLYGFDLNIEATELTKQRTDSIVSQVDFLSHVIENYSSGLFESNEKFDMVIANPPYIRTQVLGAERAQEISNSFNLEGRIDIYYAFLEGIHRVLKNDGYAGIIVSNRFMSTRSGSVVRKRITENFDIVHVWDFGDTRLFEAAVLPAVLLLKKKGTLHCDEAKLTTIYSSNEKLPAILVKNPIEAIQHTGLVTFNNKVFDVKTGSLNTCDDVWKITNSSLKDWTEIVDKHTWKRFGEIGKIRVGIKTTADKVFVRRNWIEPKPELLRPLITHNEGRRFKSLESTFSVLYTHESIDGKKRVIELDKYPISEKYLLEYKEVLTKREYVIKANRQWYEIWVPQKPDAWKLPKLVFPDISEKPKFWLSLIDEVIQGDCYWIIAENGNSEDLLWLALAVGNSSFIEEYYDNNFNNKLYAGRRRFMTQYVEKFPLPNPELEYSKELVRLAKEIYRKIDLSDTTELQRKLDGNIRKAFGLE